MNLSIKRYRSFGHRASKILSTTILSIPWCSSSGCKPSVVLDMSFGCELLIENKWCSRLGCEPSVITVIAVRDASHLTTPDGCGVSPEML